MWTEIWTFFDPLPPLRTILVNKAYVIIWTFGKPPSPCCVHMVYECPLMRNRTLVWFTQILCSPLMIIIHHLHLRNLASSDSQDFSFIRFYQILMDEGTSAYQYNFRHGHCYLFFPSSLFF